MKHSRSRSFAETQSMFQGTRQKLHSRLDNSALFVSLSTNQRQQKEQMSSPERKLRTVADVLSRLRWSQNDGLDADTIIIGYSTTIELTGIAFGMCAVQSIHV
jgi:hypothetical protein